MRTRCAPPGARLVDLGHNDRGTGAGVRGLEPWEIEAAITPRTAAFAFSASPANVADLAVVVSTCRKHKIPVIVDAAAQLPPKSNLRNFIELGADLVAFSGGKAIGGPQASGILAGRRDLVGAALVQQLDMDVSPSTWTPPDLIDTEKMKGVPHHGLGRGFKAGKEEIVGLLVALERFAAADDEAANAALETRLSNIARGLQNACQYKLVPAAETGRVPQLHLTLKQPLEVEPPTPGGRSAGAPLGALRRARNPGRRSAGATAAGRRPARRGAARRIARLKSAARARCLELVQKESGTGNRGQSPISDISAPAMGNRALTPIFAHGTVRAIPVGEVSNTTGRTHETSFVRKSADARRVDRRHRHFFQCVRAAEDRQGRRAAFAVRHDGDQRDGAEGHGADGDRRDQRQGRRDGREDRAGRRRPGLQLAAVRREGAPAPHPGQGRGGRSAAGPRCRASRCCRCSRS